MEFKSQCQLRSSGIKNALKAYVIVPLTLKYQVCAVRFLCVDCVSKEKIWITRLLLESLLEENQIRIAARAKTIAEQMFCPGMSLWIVFKWPEYGWDTFEEYISKKILAAGLNLRSCKAIRHRGKISLILFS